MPSDLHLTNEDVEQWLTENERTIAWLARKSGIETSYLWRIVKGQRSFPPELQERVREVIQ